jgi:hypothetical protein
MYGQRDGHHLRISVSLLERNNTNYTLTSAYMPELKIWILIGWVKNTSMKDSYVCVDPGQSRRRDALCSCTVTVCALWMYFYPRSWKSIKVYYYTYVFHCNRRLAVETHSVTVHNEPLKQILCQFVARQWNEFSASTYVTRHSDTFCLIT